MWHYFLVYCIVCWCLAALYVACRWRYFKRDLELERERTGTIRTAITKPLEFIFQAPLTLCVVLSAELYDISRATWRRWRDGPPYLPDLSKDYMYIPIAFDDVPSDISEWWQDGTRRLEPLGFSAVGTYSQRDDSYEHKVYDHLLWHKRGTVAYSLGGLVYPKEINTYQELFTVLANGTVVCTASIEHPKGWGRPDLKRDKHMTYAARSNLEQIYWWHLKEVVEVASQLGVDVLAFRHDQHQAFSTYHKRNFSQWMWREDFDEAPPPAPMLPKPLGSLRPDELQEAHGVSGRAPRDLGCGV